MLRMFIDEVETDGHIAVDALSRHRSNVPLVECLYRSIWNGNRQRRFPIRPDVPMNSQLTVCRLDSFQLDRNDTKRSKPESGSCKFDPYSKEIMWWSTQWLYCINCSAKLLKTRRRVREFQSCQLVPSTFWLAITSPRLFNLHIRSRGCSLWSPNQFRSSCLITKLCMILNASVELNKSW